MTQFIKTILFFLLFIFVVSEKCLGQKNKFDCYDTSKYIIDLKKIVQYGIDNLNSNKRFISNEEYLLKNEVLLERLDSLKNKYSVCGTRLPGQLDSITLSKMAKSLKSKHVTINNDNNNNYFRNGISYLQSALIINLLGKGLFEKTKENMYELNGFIHSNTSSKRWEFEIGDEEIIDSILGIKYSFVDLFVNDSTQRLYSPLWKKLKIQFDYRPSFSIRMVASSKLQEVFSQKLYDRLRVYIIISILAIVLIVILFAYTIFQLKRNKHQARIIEIQKELVEQKHNEITDSINYAKRIQYSLLASNKLLNDNLPNHFLFFKPKDVVSGDFYWGSKLSSSSFVLVTADSTGHGVPGSIMSMLNISCLNEAINADKLIQPADILNATRKKIIEHLSNDGSAEGGKDGMDCSLVSFDFINKKLIYAAANNPVWIVRFNRVDRQLAGGDVEFIALTADRMPVGKHDKDILPFTEHEFDLQSGDMVYTLTDGFPDQFGGPKGKKFKYKQLEELLLSIAHESMEIQKQKLEEVFENWKGNLEQVDDVCIIGIRI